MSELKLGPPAYSRQARHGGQAGLSPQEMRGLPGTHHRDAKARRTRRGNARRYKNKRFPRGERAQPGLKPGEEGADVSQRLKTLLP